MDRRVPIAIVGFGCRFPKARDPQAFWRLLRDGSDAITEVPADRGWDLAALYDPDRISSGTMNTRWGGFVDGVAEFDPDFFGVSVGEACGMDPQQRLVLEVAWEALEHANIAADRLSASDTSVFIGACNVDYPTAAFGDLARINAYYTAGTASCMIANRVSHFLDLRGPSIGVDTGCSSSLVAAHLACQSLARGETSLALVGGVNLVLSPRTTVGLSQSWMMAPDGRCKSFDARANGYVRGEGCGLVVLKRLDDALRDGDEIHGVLLGSAVNQDGRGIGLTSPNRSALEAVMVQALQQAGVEAEDVDLIEAHGIGSALTDAIEGQALSAVYGKASREGGACLVGSVKTNIGHLESAAGAAGLIKVLLALRNREIPRHLHFQALNPRLAESPFPLAIPIEATPWGKAKDTGRPRLAGINSFGLGGTNAHLLVGEWSRPVDASVADEAESRLYILPLSAKSTQALRALASRYAAHLSAHPEDSLAAVCRTAAVGRSHFAHRLAVSARSRAELIAQLEAFAEGRELSTPSSDTPDDARRLASAAAYVRGDDVDGKALQLVDGAVGPRVSLPTYPFQRRQCWPGSERRKGPKAARSSVRPEPIAQPARSRSAPIELAAELDANARPLLADHWIHGSIVVSGPTQVAMLLDASAPSKAAGPLLLEDLAFLQPLILDEGTSRATRIVLTPLSDGGHRFRIDTRAAGTGHAEDPWVTHSSGTIDRRAPVASPAPLDRAQLERCRDEALSGEALYQSMSRRGIELGPAFRWLDRLWTAEGEALCQMRAASASDGVENGSLHPGRFDSCFQLLFACPGAPPEGEAYMLLGVDRIRLVQSDGHRFCHARLRPGDRGETFSGDVTIFDEAGNPAVTLEGIHFKRAPRAALQNSAASASVLAPSVHTAGAAREDAELIRRLAAEPAHEHGAIVLAFVREEAASVLQQDPASLDPDRGLFDLGMSSLMSLELSNRLRIAVGRSVPLPTTLVFDRPTIAGLSEYLLARLKGTSEVAPRAAVVPATSVAAVPAQSANEHEPIAIIGLGCRFPGGAEDPETFWAILRDGVDAITEVPPERWSLDAWFDPNPDAPGKMYTKYGGFVKGVDRFDAAFFGIAPREAISLDPQHRLLLEVSWEALEHAGIAPDGLVGTRTGTFVGTCFDDYAKFSMNAGDPAAITAYAGTGVESCFTAGRLSYVLGLSGPAMHVDTACSTSLVAIHLACQSLRMGESNLALAGASNLMLSPDNTVYFSKLRAMAADGRCRSFDAGASGYVRGEGCGVVVLKRLSDAIRDGDRVLGLIRGSAVNHDGKSSGLTVPNGAAQEAVIRDALSRAQIAPSQVGYVEAHGSGTPIGDPIEMRALGAVLGEGRAPEDRFLVGSVKTNIGHLEPAAGVAGIIKLVLAFQHEEIPAHLHFQKINPLIELEDAKAAIATARTPWPAGSRRRVAGISAFGLSGTNAHVIVEEPPRIDDRARIAPTASSYLLPLSAKGPEALSALSQSYRALLSAEPSGGDLPASLHDITYTASVRRSHHEHRLAVVGRTREELAAALDAFARGEAAPGLASGRVLGDGRVKVVFVFPGQGSQWVGMGRSLLDEEPAFREALEACDEVIRRESGFSVLEEIRADEGRSRLGEIDVLQPTLFAIEIALAALWRSWGVEPSAVVGHSMGEAAAAHVAGALRLEDAAAVICRRSRLLRRVSGKGAMALVELTIEQAQEALKGLEDRLSVAVSNGPRSTVIAGDPAALEEVLSKLEAQQVFCRRVKVDVASHSPQMDPLLAELTTALSGITSTEPSIPMRSTVSGELIAGTPLDAQYWTRNLRAPVLFSRAIRALAESGPTLFVEMSPHPILVQSIVEGLRHDDRAGAAFPSLRREQDARRSLLESLGGLYVHGYSVPFQRQYPSGGRVVTLPKYPWQRDRYWLDAPAQGVRRVQGVGSGHPLLGAPIAVSMPGARVWEQAISVEVVPYLADHRVQGEVVFPGAGMVEMALAAGAELYGKEIVLEDLAFDEMLALPPSSARHVQLLSTEEGPGRTSFTIASRAEGETTFRRHASGKLGAGGGVVVSSETPEKIQERLGASLLAEDHYPRLETRGLSYGAAFQGLEHVWFGDLDDRGEREVLGRVRLPAQAGAADGVYHVHPALLDACLQVSIGAYSAAEDEGTFVPVGIERVRFHARPNGAVWVRGKLRRVEGPSDQSRAGDFILIDDEGRALLEIEGLRARRLDDTSIASKGPLDGCIYSVEWRRDDQATEADARPTSTGDQATAGGTWLIFADRAGTGEALASMLSAQGEACVRVTEGERFTRVGPELYRVDPRKPDDHLALLREVFGEEGRCRGVVHLWSLDATTAEETTPEALGADVLHGTVSAARVAQALVRHGFRDVPRLWLVTRGAQGPSADRGGAVAQAPLWGLGRTIALEHPELETARVDLDPSPEVDGARLLMRALRSNDREDQIAFRGGSRYVARLVRESATTETAEQTRPLLPANGRPFRLVSNKPGVLEALALQEARRSPPGPGEVEIAVEVAGLNFADVMKAMGIYPGLPPGPVPLGGECAGRIVAIGEGVTGFEIGQDVVAVVPSAFTTHVTAPAYLVAPRPRQISAEQAAVLPLVFMTVWYALHHLGRARPGERILIHSASGGTGLAAIQIARSMGLEIFATAGSEEKREFVRSLGVRVVMDSRSASFAAELMRETGGAGVDLVLNSLTGEAREKSLEVVAPYGRFLELGKREIYENTRIGLFPFRKNISYFAIDLAGMADDRPQLFASLLGEVMERVRAGAFEPLPVQIFPASESERAFRLMAQAKHIGKIAIAMRDESACLASADERKTAIRPDASYLITGGLGALGLSAARWMVEQGARHLALVGRRRPSEEARKVIASMEEAGARVLVLEVDVAKRGEVAELLSKIDEHLPPLRGIVHSAGLLDDHTLLELTEKHFQSVFDPKIHGAWNLHALTLDKPLDFFVMYSSVASLLGSPGQGNYTAANAFLDALAHHRRGLGLPAMSIQWGGFSEAGLAAVQENRGKRAAYRGIGSFTLAEGVVALSRLLERPRTEVGVVRFDARQWIEFYPNMAASPFFLDLRRESPETHATTVASASFRQQLERASSSERCSLLEDHLREHLVSVLRLRPSQIERHASFTSIGMDSLMSLELRNRIEASLGLKLSATLLYTYANVGSLAEHLAGRFGAADAEASSTTGAIERDTQREVASEPSSTAAQSGAMAAQSESMAAQSGSTADARASSVDARSDVAAGTAAAAGRALDDKQQCLVNSLNKAEARVEVVSSKPSPTHETHPQRGALRAAAGEPIAIIGMGCRFPGGGDDPNAFFDALEAGVDGIRRIPAERWPQEVAADKPAMRWAGLLHSVDGFDASFFEISPREATSLDPQQRLLLEVTWEALENAGQRPHELMNSRTGVFVGMCNIDYKHALDQRTLDQFDAYCCTGNLFSTAAGRVSYTFGFQGPCVSVDTACSSSLVAVHLACQSLRSGECELALAGGVNVILSPVTMALLAETQALSPDGRSKTFDAGANGFVRAEGCGVVALKRLSDAQRDGDPILAVIRGSVVNQDGRSTGLMTPNVLSQQSMLRQALERAGISPADMTYVETHGTGTSLGDPIELEALKTVLGEQRKDGSRCVLGAVKTNIGHLEAAAGVAGLIKTVLCLQRERIPRNLHFKTLNPRISLDGTPFVIPTETTPWKAGDKRRIAGVSAFGLSGTNAHIVVEEAPATEQQKAPPREVSSHLLPLSAKGPEALKALAQSYHALLKSNRAEVSLDDITYTASVRRSHHTHRLAVVASTRDEMAAALEAFANGDAPASVVSGTAAGGGRLKIIFVFPGQGSQWVGMGRSLLDEEPAFREAIEACDAVIRRESGFSVLEELCADEARSRLGAIDVLQPTLFAVEVALAALWRAWGVEPNAVVGHSMGEAAAAYVAGALRLEDAAAIICRRSRLLRRMSGKGAMALVELTLQEAEQALEGLGDRLSVAVSNGPRSTVIAGDPAALEEVLARLEAAEVFCRRVKVDVASHSPQMDPLLEELTTTLSGLQPKEGAIPMRSTVTGEEIAGSALDAKYWARNLRAPVLFARAIRALAESGTTIFVEMSPHPILVPAITEGLRHDEREGAALPSLRRDHDGRRALLASLGALYTCGYRVPFERQYPSGGHVVSLPSYPWQRERYWLEPPKQSSRRLGHAAGHPLVGEPIELSIQPGTFLFRLETHAADVAYLKDHQVDGSVVLPAAAYVEAALSAAAAVHGGRPMQIKDLSLKAAMVLPDDGPIEVQLALSPTDTEETSFRFQSRRPPSLAWTTNASGTLAPSEVAAPQVSTRPGEIVARCPDEISGDRHDEAMRARGIVYGPAFRGLERMWRRAIDQGAKGEVEAIGRLSLPGSELSRQGAYRIHPALLDAALQVLGSLSSDGEMYLPVGIARLALLRPPPPSAFCHAQLRTSDADLVEGELRILDEEGAVILQAEGVRLRRIPRAAAHPLSDVMFALEWRSRAAQEPSKPEAPGRWLILDRPEGGGGALAASLEARGDQAILVRPGDAYARVDAAHYVVSPSQPTSYERLIRDALEDGVPCRGVVHLFGRGELAEGQSRSALESALHLVQALATAKLREEPRLWLVTSGVQMPTAATTVDGSGVAQGALWGFARAVAHEHPELRCSLVDVAAGPALDGDALARELVADAPEDQVVLRPGARHVARLVRSEPLPLAEPLRLRDDATYLISGGLGGLGLTIARWMVDRGARHIVLMGRRPPSEVATRAIDEMRAAGAEVRPVRADVSLPEDVARTLSEIDRNMPALAGVLHAAAVLDDGTLLKLDSERFDAVMAPKARGAWNLHVQTLERPLDFFVLFSSGAGVLGSMGQASYGGANAVLDALAHHRRAARLPALSIDWGAWTGVGWVAADAERGDRLAAQGIRGISVEQGLLALEELIQRGATQSVVTSIDWRQWREAHLTAANAPLLAEIEAEPGSSVRKRSGELRAALEAAEPASRRTMLEQHLREQIGQVLRMPPARIEASTPFGSLGLDSLMGLEIRNRLEASLGLKLSATLLWTVPTVTALLPYLAEKMGLALGDATPKPAPAAQPEGLSIDKGDKLRTALASLKKVSPEDLRRALAEAATTKRRRA